MDELRRLRELADAVPEPDPDRKAAARAELLQLAEEQQATAAERPADDPVDGGEVVGPARRRWADRWASWRERFGPAPATGVAAAALLAVVGAGALLTELGPGAPADVADPGEEAAVLADPDEATDPAETPEPAEDSDPVEQPEERAVELAATCTEPEEGLTVAYPEGWATPADGEPGACRFFGEEAVDVDLAVGGDALAEVEVRVEPVPVDELAADELGLVAHARDDLELGGREVVRQRFETTGQGALPAGVWLQRYLIALDDRTLLIASHADDEATLDARQPVLDEMARQVEAADPA